MNCPLRAPDARAVMAGVEIPGTPGSFTSEKSRVIRSCSCARGGGGLSAQFGISFYFRQIPPDSAATHEQNFSDVRKKRTIRNSDSNASALLLLVKKKLLSGNFVFLFMSITKNMSIYISVSITFFMLMYVHAHIYVYVYVHAHVHAHVSRKRTRIRTWRW